MVCKQVVTARPTKLSLSHIRIADRAMDVMVAGKSDRITRTRIWDRVMLNQRGPPVYLFLANTPNLQSSKLVQQMRESI